MESRGPQASDKKDSPPSLEQKKGVSEDEVRKAFPKIQIIGVKEWKEMGFQVDPTDFPPGSIEALSADDKMGPRLKRDESDRKEASKTEASKFHENYEPVLMPKGMTLGTFLTSPIVMQKLGLVSKFTLDTGPDSPFAKIKDIPINESYWLLLPKSVASKQLRMIHDDRYAGGQEIVIDPQEAKKEIDIVTKEYPMLTHIRRNNGYSCSNNYKRKDEELSFHDLCGSGFEYYYFSRERKCVSFQT